MYVWKPISIKTAKGPIGYSTPILDRVKRIWYLSPMRAAKVQASLRIRAVSPEPSLLAHTSSESRGTFRQKARSLAPLNGWACAVKICHDGMLEDTNSLDGAHFMGWKGLVSVCISLYFFVMYSLNHHRIPSEWNLKGLLYLFEIYSKYNHLILDFPTSFGETRATMQSLFIWHSVSDKTNGTVIETWILPFYFYYSFPWARETIKWNVKLKTSIKKYPTPPVSPKYHLWMPILEQNGVSIHILCCNLHISDILFVKWHWQ